MTLDRPKRNLLENDLILKDDPIRDSKNDYLNSSALVDSLQKIILNPSNIKMIGLFGRWGIGKTSILYLLKNKLVSHNIQLEIIDAWKLMPDNFLKEFLVELNEKLNAIDRKELINKLIIDTEVTSHNYKKKILYSLPFIGLLVTAIILTLVKQNIKDFLPVDLANSLVSVLAISGIFFSALPFLEKILDKFEKTFLNVSAEKTIYPRPQLSYQFQDLQKELIQNWKGKNHQKDVVIAIDNLDRCSPEVAIRLLEMVKIYSDTMDCKYIISIDPDIIKKYLVKEKAMDDTYADQFLDKLFVNKISIPPITSKNLSNYTLKKLEESGFPDFNKIAEIIIIINPTPRKVNNIINSIKSAYGIAHQKEEEEHLRQRVITENLQFLTKITILREEFFNFYHLISTDIGILRDSNRYVASRSEYEMIDPELKNLLDTNPKLKNFLFSTVDVHSKDDLAFINFEQEDHLIRIDNSEEFYQKITEGDKQYINSKLIESDGKYYCISLIRFTTDLLKNGKHIMAVNGISILIDNFETCYKYNPGELINFMDTCISNISFVSLFNSDKINVRKLFGILSYFSELSKIKLLSVFTNKMFNGGFDEDLLRSFLDYKGALPSATINTISSEISKNFHKITTKDQLLKMLMENSTSKTNFIDEQVVNSVIESIPNSPTYSELNANVDLYLMIKEFSTKYNQLKFIIMITEFLIDQEHDIFVVSNPEFRINGFQNMAMYSLMRLNSDEIPSSEIRSLYKNIMRMRELITLRDASSKYHEDDILRCLLKIYPKLDIDHKNEVVSAILIPYVVAKNGISSIKENLRNTPIVFENDVFKRWLTQYEYRFPEITEIKKDIKRKK